MERFDNYYINIAQEAGGIEKLLESFFSFMLRRTDFFYESEPNDKMGFLPGMAEKMVLGVFRHFQNEYYKKHPKKSVEEYQKKLEALKQHQAQANTTKADDQKEEIKKNHPHVDSLPKSSIKENQNIPLNKDNDISALKTQISKENEEYKNIRFSNQYLQWKRN
jgi:hypothetical protein